MEGVEKIKVWRATKFVYAFGRCYKFPFGADENAFFWTSPGDGVFHHHSGKVAGFLRPLEHVCDDRCTLIWKRDDLEWSGAPQRFSLYGTGEDRPVDWIPVIRTDRGRSVA